MIHVAPYQKEVLYFVMQVVLIFHGVFLLLWVSYQSREICVRHEDLWIKAKQDPI